MRKAIINTHAGFYVAEHPEHMEYIGAEGFACFLDISSNFAAQNFFPSANSICLCSDWTEHMPSSEWIA